MAQQEPDDEVALELGSGERRVLIRKRLQFLGEMEYLPPQKRHARWVRIGFEQFEPLITRVAGKGLHGAFERELVDAQHQLPVVLAKLQSQPRISGDNGCPGTD